MDASHRTTIIVALIGLVGVVLAAIIGILPQLDNSNGDFPNDRSPGAPIEIIANSENTTKRDGVKSPSETDYSYAWGNDILLDEFVGDKHIPPDSGTRFAEWYFHVEKKGKYRVSITYASGERRPLRLLINNVIALDKVADETTGGFNIENRSTRNFGIIELSSDYVTIRLESADGNQMWPHFQELRLTYIEGT